MGKWIRRFKEASRALRGSAKNGDLFAGFADFFRKKPMPSAAELVHYFRNTQFSCASINAKGVARYPMLLYVATTAADKKCPFVCSDVADGQLGFLKSNYLTPRKYKGVQTVIDEVVQHPALELLDNPNPYMDYQILIEVTQLSQEILGKAFWWIERDDIGRPAYIWVLPAQYVTPVCEGNDVVTKWEFTIPGSKAEFFSTDEVVFFRCPSIASPYTAGFSPVMGMFETITNVETDIALSHAMMRNRNRPDLWVSPKDYVGEDEAERVRAKLRTLLGGVNNYNTIVTESAMNIKSVSVSPKDMESFVRFKEGKEDICNAFDVPLALFSENTNMANLSASLVQHATYGLLPRLNRNAGVLTHRYLPMWGVNNKRLFFGFENPIPEDEEKKANVRKINILSCVSTPDEERRRVGEGPLPNGSGREPLLPAGVLPFSEAVKLAHKNAAPKPVPGKESE